MNGKRLIIAMISVGVALGGLMLNGHAQINSDIQAMQEEIADLRERMARLEGLFGGFTKRAPEDR